MHGFGSHTYSFINAENQRVWVKFHFKTEQGIQNLTNEQGAEVVGTNRESHQKDLFESIERKEYPRWKFFVQIMTQEQAKHTAFNPFDLTKVWPHGDFPMIEVGYFELNRNPENYFAQVEQAAFEPSNMVPGVSWSPDKMLQSRIFAYADAHRYRIGANYDQLPVNKPRVEVNNYNLDGKMRSDVPEYNGAYYEPNSFGGPVQQEEFKEPALVFDDPTMDRFNHRIGNDDYSQCRALFELMSLDQRRQLLDNISEHMRDGKVPLEIVQRQIDVFLKVHPDYGLGVAERLGIKIADDSQRHSRTAHH